jgi:hypothetical protein
MVSIRDLIDLRYGRELGHCFWWALIGTSEVGGTERGRNR